MVAFGFGFGFGARVNWVSVVVGCWCIVVVDWAYVVVGLLNQCGILRPCVSVKMLMIDYQLMI